MAPVVSVVLATRNRSSRVGRAIDSVLRQTFGELELLVIDDASTDDTPRVLAEYTALDSRVRVARNHGAGGAPAARNRGIALARSRRVAFLDDDAVWLPTKLERQLTLLEREGPGCGLVYSQFVYHDERGVERVIGSDAATAGRARSVLLRRNFIDTSTVLARRDVLGRVNGFDEALPRLQDWDLWLRLSELAAFAYVPEPLVHCYFTPGGISTRSDALATACRLLISKLEGRPDVDRHELADWCYALGHVLMVGGAPADGRRTLWRSLRLRPWPPRHLVMGTLSALGPRAYGAVAALHASTQERSLDAAPGPRGG